MPKPLTVWITINCGKSFEICVEKERGIELYKLSFCDTVGFEPIYDLFHIPSPHLTETDTFGADVYCLDKHVGESAVGNAFNDENR